jgi:hypothetical protein
VLAAAIAAEVACYFAPVDADIGGRVEDISDLAFACRRCLPDPPRLDWPVWWSDSRETDYRRRVALWYLRRCERALL